MKKEGESLVECGKDGEERRRRDPESLEDDARACGDDSRIRYYPGHTEKCIFSGFI